MKLSHLKNIIKEELKRLGPLQKEDISGGCSSGSCSVRMGEETFHGFCKPVITANGHYCRCQAGPHTLDCYASEDGAPLTTPEDGMVIRK